MTDPRFIPAAYYLARQRMRKRTALRQQSRISRCGECGQWAWDGVCTLHPGAEQATY